MALYGARAVDNPDAFVGRVTLSQWEAYPVLTGTAYSSHAPASTWFHPVAFPNAIQISNVYVFKSLNVSVPGATSQASTGSEGYTYTHGITLFQRQDYSANSTNLSAIATASIGLTATLNYQSTTIGNGSQSFGMSWVTNSTGGTSGVSTTSSNAAWSNSASGPFAFPIPFVTGLSAGEYWFAHAHSSTAATSNSAVTLLSLSNLHIAPQQVTFGLLGNSATAGSLAQMGAGLGIASAVTTSTTMAASVISAGAVSLWVQNFSNA